MATVGRGPGRGEHGFGILEVMVSLSVLLVIMLATSYLMDDVVKQAATSREKVAATELAEQWLEQLSNAPISSLQTYIARDVQLTAQPVVVAGIGFTVWGHLEWADTGATHSLCTSGNPPQVIRATVTVKWQGQQLGETTVINPPYGTVVPGDGFLSIQIYGLNAPSPPSDTSNLINVPVTVTPTNPSGAATTYNPDQYGCVYLLEPLGTYSVSLGSPSGGPTFIDYQENLTPTQTSQTVTVAGLATSVPVFHYDEAGTVALSPSAAAPIAGGMPISVSNTGPMQAVAVAAGSNGTSAQLFPYASAYSVWYGDCAAVSGKPTMEEPTTPATVSVTPRGSSAATITGLDVLNIQATRAAGNFNGAVSARATINDPNAAPGVGFDGCPTVDSTGGEAFTLTGFSGATNVYSSQTAILPQTYSVAVTDASTGGGTATFAMAIGAAGVTYGGHTYPYGTPVPVSVP
jgi:Tfp pilus assembly protein PilV